MARDISEVYEDIAVDDLNRPLVFVVDMNNGFAREGALADPEIEKAAAPIEEIFRMTGQKGIFVCDTHDPDAREFASFPPHCLRGDAESDILESLKPYVEDIVEKNAINAFVSPDFARVLPLLADRDIVVTGCCTDLCVLQLALSLQSYINQNGLDSRVIVPVDCVETYDIEGIHPAGKWNDFALENMKANGIQVVGKIREAA